MLPHPTVVDIAERYNITVPHLCVTYTLQLGAVAPNNITDYGESGVFPTTLPGTSRCLLLTPLLPPRVGRAPREGRVYGLQSPFAVASS
jgi:hypothetical protein